MNPVGLLLLSVVLWIAAVVVAFAALLALLVGMLWGVGRLIARLDPLGWDNAKREARIAFRSKHFPDFERSSRRKEFEDGA